MDAAAARPGVATAVADWLSTDVHAPAFAGGQILMLLTAASLHFSEDAEDSRTDVSLVTLAAGLGVLAQRGLPRVTLTLLLTANLSLIFWSQLPFCANHVWVWILSLVVVGPVLAADSSAQTLPWAGPLCSRVVGAAYLWAGIHKCNQAFFDPHESCMENFRHRWMGLVPEGARHLIPAPPHALFILSAAMVVLLEVAAGALALFGNLRWRRYGILAGLLALHAPTALISFYDFGSVALAAAYLTLGADSAVPHRIVPGADARVVRFAAANLVLGVLWRLLHFASPELIAKASPVGRYLQMLRGIAVACLAVPIVWQAPRPAWALREKVRPRKRVAVWLPRLAALYAFVHGASPYIGLGTASAFTMFSNLRVDPDGATNHYLVHRTADPFHLQRDLVRWRTPESNHTGKRYMTSMSGHSGLGEQGMAPATLLRSHFNRAWLVGVPVGPLLVKRVGEPEWRMVPVPEYDEDLAANTLASHAFLFRSFPVGRGCVW